MSDYIIDESSIVGDIIPLDTVKDFLRVDSDITEDDDLIKSLTTSAALFAEGYLNKVLQSQSLVGAFAVPCNAQIKIPRSPVTEITSIVVKENSGDKTLVVDEDFIFIQSNQFSKVCFLNSFDYKTNHPYPISITFTAGFSELPKDIETGLKTHINYLYENRGDVISEGSLSLPKEAEILYTKHAIVGGYGG